MQSSYEEKTESTELQAFKRQKDGYKVTVNRCLLISGVFFNFRSANFTIIWLKSPLSKTINRKWHFLRLIV